MSETPLPAEENWPLLNFIQMSRVYDALMALLTVENKDLANKLLQAHARGDLVMVEPMLSGVFLTNAQQQ